MSFYEAIESEQDAPKSISRRDLKMYKDFLDSLQPGKVRTIIVPTGKEALRKVREVDENGKPKVSHDPKTGKMLPVYKKDEHGNYVMEPYGYAHKKRGEEELASERGLIQAGRDSGWTVHVTATYMGRGHLETNEAGVKVWVENPEEPEKTRFAIQKEEKKDESDTVGGLQKKIGFSEARAKMARERLERAVEATDETKAEIQKDIKKYEDRAKKYKADLAALNGAAQPAKAAPAKQQPARQPAAGK